MRVDIEKLLELESKASPGPWVNDVADSYSPLRGQAGETIADFDCEEPDTHQGKLNCLFVEEMRNSIKDLCLELKAAREFIDSFERVNGARIEWNKVLKASEAYDYILNLCNSRR